ncbi:MAG: Cobalt-zinc-cadmium resistance protein CzcD, partial [uncultured Thermoleophilia bacterium]
VSGLLVVAVGGMVLRGHVRAWRAQREHAHAHAHGHTHHHDHHHHDHHGHHHHGPGGHSHAPPDRITARGLIGMGAAAGLIPCPSALVVLLAAVSQQEVALGMLLIVVFSLGLAGTLTALGLAVVAARALAPRLRLPPRIVTVVPALSAVVIVGAGCLLTLQALPQLV